MQRHLVIGGTVAALTVGGLALAAPAFAGTQDYAYTCPPLDTATITLAGTAPPTVQPNGSFTISDGVVSGTVELGQFAAFVNDGTVADVTATVIFGAAGDANVDPTVSTQITLHKSGTTASFSQALPPVNFTAGPDAATAVAIAPGQVAVSLGGAGATCTRTGSEGPFATIDIVGAALETTATTPTTAPPAAAAPAGGSSTGGASLAHSGLDRDGLLLVGGGAVLVAVAAARLSRRAQRGALRSTP